MKKFIPLVAICTLLFAPLLTSQQQTVTLADEDSVLIEGQVLENPAFAWTGLAANTYNRSRPGGSWVGTKFYLIGGELSSGTWGFTRADTVEIFDGVTSTWSASAASMPIPVSNIMGSTAASGSKIYLFGGWDEFGLRTDQIQVYDTVADSWSLLPVAYPAGDVYGCLAISLPGGKIFCCGGTTASGVATASAYIFDPISNVFTPVASMPTARYHLTGDISGDTIYVPAGFGTGTALEAYSISTDSWTVLPSIPTDRAGCGVIAVARYCVMFCGNWGSYYNDAEVYDSLLGVYSPAIAASLGTAPVGKRAFAYGSFQNPNITAFVAMDGWAGAYLDDCAAIF